MWSEDYFNTQEYARVLLKSLGFNTTLPNDIRHNKNVFKKNGHYYKTYGSSKPKQITKSEYKNSLL